MRTRTLTFFAPFKRTGQLVLESLQGVPRNYTRGSISKALIVLGIPMVVEMTMESMFAVADIFFVGRLGPAATATLGLTESLLGFVYTLALGLSIGATVMVSQRIGEDDPEKAAATAVQAFFIGAILSALTAAFGVSFAPQLLRMMGGSPELVVYATPFMRITFGGITVVFMLEVANGIFRGAGDGAIAMRALALSNVVNLILTPCLVFGFHFIPKLGVVGAACSTTAARGIGAIYALSHLFGGQGRIKVRMRELRLHLELMSQVLKVSAFGAIQMFISTASWIGTIRVISTFGYEAIAGFTIGTRVILFAILPASGLSNAASTMVGQSLGAGQPDRAEKAVWLTALYNFGFLGLVGLIFLIFARPIVAWFTADPTVYGYAVSFLRTVTFGVLFYAVGMVLGQAFNGSGDTWTPTWINFFGFWAFQIPAAWVLSHSLGMGPQGVFLAVTLAFSATSVASAVVFRQGRWKTKRV